MKQNMGRLEGQESRQWEGKYCGVKSSDGKVSLPNSELTALGDADHDGQGEGGEVDRSTSAGKAASLGN